MKYIYKSCFQILPFILLIFACAPNKTTITTFILMRHAEKMTETSADPDLSSKGLKRANHLSKFLEAVPIDAIYSTPFRRTMDTVKPLSNSKLIDIYTYSADQLDAFSEDIVKKYSGKTVVIVGHSNTTPRLVNAITGSEFTDLEEDEYDWIYIVDLLPSGSSKIKKLKIEI